MDIGSPSYSHNTYYYYDESYLNLSSEHKVEPTSGEAIRTYFTYTSAIPSCAANWILSKPTWIRVYDTSYQLKSAKWMDYDCNTGNIQKEEVCKSDNPASWCLNRDPNQNPLTSQNPMISYQYDTYKNLWKITDPRGYQTTITYDSTKTHVYQTTNALGHVTTTEYDPGTGNLKKLIPPHLQGTVYSITNTYDVFGRKTREDRPDGGWTSYQYLSFGNPNTQHVKKRERIVGGPSVLEHDTRTYFDGLGRTYKTSSTGPYGNNIVTETSFDLLGRVWKKSNPRFCDANDQNCETRYDTFFTYDGLSRVVETAIPDDNDPSGYTYISQTYQGLKKIVTNQRENSTAYTYDVYQRLKKVEDPYGTFTEYSYDTLGNLTQVRAAKDGSGNNLLGASITTTMTYDSLSKKRTMNDPDMRFWEYEYDKAGNLVKQWDANHPKPQLPIEFQYDGLNRLTQKTYPDRSVTYTYDDPTVPYSKGKLTKVSDPSGGEEKEDRVLEYDLMQRVKQSRKKIGAEEVTFENAYDSIGRVINIKYLAGTPNEKTYSYQYDVTGNLLYLKDNAAQNNVVAYSNFTALGQPRQANFSNSVSTTYEYYPRTKRLQGLFTQKPGTPAYQQLGYQYDPNGNITILTDTKNNITHSYTYDSLDRLLTAQGAGTNPYTQSYQYDRIGNITYKSDVGNYSYFYNNKPHAVRTAGNISLQYDLNGNMTQRAEGGVTLDLIYNYDNKPDLIKKNGANYVQFTYDGNGQRVKKVSPAQTVLYFGELYEVRGGVASLHLFAGNRRVASIRSDGRTQFYHGNHLGSASFITDSNGDPWGRSWGRWFKYNLTLIK
jgi:YD repeat-containing protein